MTKSVDEGYEREAVLKGLVKNPVYLSNMRLLLKLENNNKVHVCPSGNHKVLYNEDTHLYECIHCSYTRKRI